MEISKYLKKRREELGLTLNEVASQVGVNNSTVSRWESGDINNMKRDKIVKYAAALKISPAIIMGWEDRSSDNELNHLYTSMDINNKRHLLEYARFLNANSHQGKVATVTTKNPDQEDNNHIVTINDTKKGG